MEEIKEFLVAKWHEGIDISFVLRRVAFASLFLAAVYFCYVYVVFAVGYYKDELFATAKLMGSHAQAAAKVAGQHAWTVACFPYNFVTNTWLYLLPIRQRLADLMALFIDGYYEKVDSLLFKDPGNVPFKNAFNSSFKFLMHWGLPITTGVAVAVYASWAALVCVQWFFPGAAIPVFVKEAGAKLFKDYGFFVGFVLLLVFMLGATSAVQMKTGPDPPEEEKNIPEVVVDVARRRIRRGEL